jgi:hypothetical protein
LGWIGKPENLYGDDEQATNIPVVHGEGAKVTKCKLSQMINLKPVLFVKPEEVRFKLYGVQIFGFNPLW